MYFADEYDNEKPFPRSGQLDSIFEHATAPSSGAAAWGLVYTDFLRTLGIPTQWFPPAFFPDRAKSLELRWERPWKNANSPTLDSWAAGVKDGWRPLLVFNATLSETGEPLLLAPIRLQDNVAPSTCDNSKSPSQSFHIRELAELYPNYDMPVVTAARLSASVPFLSPLARPSANDPAIACKAYHVADGGYFDNFGVLTVLQLLNKVLEQEDQLPSPIQVLLLEIRAFHSRNDEVPDSKLSAIREVLGPITTMSNVRWASQLVRNEYEVKEFIAKWEGRGIKVLDVVFEKDSDSPLSWHLTNQEKTAIVEAFNKEGLQRCYVKSFFSGRTMTDLERDCKERP
jgi:hypothetical protein